MVNLQRESARVPIDLKALLERAATMVADSFPDNIVPLGQESAGDSLRLRLAVRGWVNPYHLLDSDLDPELAERTVDAVSGEVDTQFSLYPGDWFLTTASRSRVCAAHSIDDLSAELNVVRWPGDSADPTRLAFRKALSLDPPSVLGELTSPELQALANVLDWLDDRISWPVNREEISAELALRTRNADLERQTALPLVGSAHREALDVLINGLDAPPATGLSATYLFGAGGTGKSTVLAFLERKLLGLIAGPIVAHLDFDDPLVNPLDPTSLHLALFGQIAQQFPSLSGYFAPLANELREMRRFQRHEFYQPQGTSRVRRRALKSSPVESLALEGMGTTASSDRGSLLMGALHASRRPEFDRALVLILDTAELVMTRGHAACVELVGWLNSLVTTLAAREVRVVIAGRDPPDGGDSGDLLDRLAVIAKINNVIELPELGEQDAIELLGNFQVADFETAQAAASAVPRNPLLLKITADALKSDAVLAADVRAAHRDRKVDVHSARIYLRRRIVAHLADPVARPYLLAAMYLPVVTRLQLRYLVMPLIDHTEGGNLPPNHKVDRVFRALRGARWLSGYGGDVRQIVFQRDIRTLVLKLLAVDEEQRKLVGELRTAAIAFHDSRKPTIDRAYALYHRAMRGDALGPIRSPEALVRYLLPAIDDLPRAIREILQPPAAGQDHAPEIQEKTTDDEWRLYLEGKGDSEGEGTRLLKRDRATEAVALYRDRPTQAFGAPPTFMIRALADLGEWDTVEVDIDAVLDEVPSWFSGKRLSSTAVSRIYWLTRFALCRDEAKISERHASLLTECCKRSSGISMSTMPAIVAVAEAGLGRSLLPEEMRNAKGLTESVTRVHLVHTMMTGRPADFQPHVDALVVVQRDWARRIQNLVDVPGLNWVQESLDRLDGQPIAAVNKNMQTLRKAVRVRWDGRDCDAGILLLRGGTTEFLRPLRQALVDAYKGEDGERVLRPIIDALVCRLSIVPLELTPEVFFKTLQRDQSAWAAALVGFADRARLLPLLCRMLTELPEATATKAHRVARSYLAWDRAICGREQTSEWPRPKGPPPR